MSYINSDYIKLDNGGLIKKKLFQEAREQLTGNAYKLWEMMIYKLAGSYWNGMSYDKMSGLTEYEYFFVLKELISKGFIELEYQFSMRIQPVTEDGADE